MFFWGVWETIGAVTGISAKTMIVVLNKERYGRDAFLANSDRNRFARDFRRDVNAARSAELSGDQDQPGQQIDLQQPGDRVIEYKLHENELNRLEKQGEKLLSRERYHIGFVNAQFGIASGDPQLVTLTAAISHRPENSSAPPRQWKVDAVTGKDLRFQGEEMP